MDAQKMQLKGGGQLCVREEGTWVRLEAVYPDHGEGLYKVWIYGRGGCLLLGTLAPEGDRLRLCRRVSRSELERSGCWPITRGETVLAFSFDRSRWHREECPERLVMDVVLQRTLRGRLMLLRRQADGFCLAAQFEPNRPFPLPVLFCLSKIEYVEGKLRAVFCFDRDGNPVVPHNEGNTGENSGTS